MSPRLRPLLFLLLLFTVTSPFAAEQRAMELANGDEIGIEIHGKAGDRVLWLPSEYGFRYERVRPLAEDLAKTGLEVWIADLHQSLFIPPGRRSLLEVDVEALAELIRAARPADGSRLFLMSAGRGAALLLIALQQLQDDEVDGLLLLHPNLMASTPTPGKPAEYLPVVDHTRAAIFLLQPENSAKLWYLRELLPRLEAAGSRVYTQVIPKVADGYQARPDATPFELEEAKKLPTILRRATRLLAGEKLTPEPGRARLTDFEWHIGSLADKLQPYPGSPPAPALRLTTLDGASIDLADHRGEVVLLNFWATWCPPCVEEIPSLGRLQQAMQGKGVTVLSVDVGEDREKVAEFLQRIPAHYPVMLDPEGGSVADWKLRAFPTTFVMDPQGHIRYGYFGGLQWDAEEVRELLLELREP